MGNKLKTYIKALKQLIDSGEEIEDIDSFKLELMREIQFWQHERFIHLIVTVLFALLTMMVLLTLVFNASIPLFLLFVMLLVLLVPYIKHYFILENGVQTLYVIYEQLTKLQHIEGFPEECIPDRPGVSIPPLK